MTAVETSDLRRALALLTPPEPFPCGTEIPPDSDAMRGAHDDENPNDSDLTRAVRDGDDGGQP